MACWCSAPSHYLNQLWFPINRKRDRLQWQSVETEWFLLRRLHLKLTSVILQTFCLGEMSWDTTAVVPTQLLREANLTWKSHYNEVIMTAMASQITSLTIAYSSVDARRRLKKTSKLRVTGLCAGNSLVTGEFPAQRASNAENVSIWWRHHGQGFDYPIDFRSKLSKKELFLQTNMTIAKPISFVN